MRRRAPEFNLWFAVTVMGLLRIAQLALIPIAAYVLVVGV